VLSTTTRRRLRPASLALTGALAVGALGAVVPAQAAPATTATTSSTTVAAAPVAVVPVQTAAQKAAAKAAARAARVAAIRTKAVRVARNQVGDRYVAGHTGPNAFDCSGLTRYVVKRSLGRSLPHYSKAQYRVTKRVAKKNLRPGDLVFFFKRGTHHVGMYIGRGRMVNATNPRGGVKIDRVFSGWYGSRYSGAGRLV
jgi:cell wall-associated NlpC family hydrolase